MQRGVFSRRSSPALPGRSSDLARAVRQPAFRDILPALPMSATLQRAIYITLAAACLLPFVSPAMALAAGMACALLHVTAFPAQSKRLSRLLIQTCIVLLGLRIELGELAAQAGNGLIFAAGTIVGAFALGFLLQRLLRTGTELTLLVSSGTAICGGSAIGAVGTAIGASASSVSVATGAIFLLNAAALYTFPAFGHALHLSDVQFGTWAGVAIHDISSVVGAGASYNPQSSVALDTANVVKLSRVIWIFPCTLFASWCIRQIAPSDRHSIADSALGEALPTEAPTDRAASSSMPKTGRVWAIIPPFIILFVLASLARTFIPSIQGGEQLVKVTAHAGFSLALFLIGSGLSMVALRAVGWRVLVQALILWLAMASVSLLVVIITVPG